jgi:ABC-type multidrug transport system fused ATPase/permease subunit
MISLHELLFNYIYKNKVTFIFYIIFTAILYPLYHIFIPDYYGKVISAFKDKVDITSVIKTLLYIYIIAIIIDDVVLYFQYLIVPNFSENITGNFFTFIINNFNYDFENIKIGEIISKMTKLPNLLFDYVDVFRIDLLKQIFVFITALFHYWGISKEIFSVFVIYLIIHYIYFFIMFKEFYNFSEKTNRFQDESYEYLNDTMQNMSTVYSLNQQQFEKNRFYDFSFKKYKEIFGKSYLYYLYGFIFWAIITISMYIIINYMLYKIYINKKITSTILISSFIITWSILSLYAKAIDSAWNLGSVTGQMYDAQIYINNISKNNKSLKTNTKKFNTGDIIVQNVYHKYENDFVLENVSLKIKKGDKVAFIGQIGSGKSTLVKLIMGYQPLIVGTIQIGNVNVNEISNNDLRKEIFYIPQKPKLFNRTLYENIIYGLDKPPSKQQVIDILNTFKISFDLDLDSSVGIEGNSISGGQRQMVWLIRSLLRPCSVLILDEPTSALDHINKKLVNSIIKKISVGKTVIIVSHDEIDSEFRKIEFKNGKVINMF